MLNILIYLSVVSLWMLGGQIWKGYRRFILPVISIILLCLKKRSFKPLLLIPPTIGILSLGYGQDSHLAQAFKYDWLVRLVYATLISLPFILIIPNKAYIIVYPITLIAFSLRLGGFKIGKYDWLWEDFARASAVSLYMMC